MVFNKLNWLYKNRIVNGKKENIVTSNNLVLANNYNAFELQNINLIRIKKLECNNSQLVFASVTGY